MSQNRSSAVMAQRAEPHDSLDYFPTPPWATRALCEWLKDRRLDMGSVWEPACGDGHMSRPLGEYFEVVRSTDVHAYGFGVQQDFLWPVDDGARLEWIITNPPFRLAREFALTALERATVGVALLVRTSFLEGGERHATLFRDRPPSDVLQFCERVPMVKGRVDPDISSATAYCWLVWRSAPVGLTALHWIPPCRRRLERASDYPSPALVAAEAAP
jgi:hypothetical protein